MVARWVLFVLSCVHLPSYVVLPNIICSLELGAGKTHGWLDYATHNTMCHSLGGMFVGGNKGSEWLALMHMKVGWLSLVLEESGSCFAAFFNVRKNTRTCCVERGCGRSTDDGTDETAWRCV